MVLVMRRTSGSQSRVTVDKHSIKIGLDRPEELQKLTYGVVHILRNQFFWNFLPPPPPYSNHPCSRTDHPPPPLKAILRIHERKIA